MRPEYNANKELFYLKRHYGLTFDNIATMTGYNISSIKAFMADPSHSWYRRFPSVRLDMLRRAIVAQKIKTIE